MNETFYDLVSELVDKTMREKGNTRLEIANVLNVSESFVKQVHSLSTTKHYNLKHLFLLADYWKVSIDKLVPQKNNLNELPSFKNKDTSKVYENLILELRKER